MVWKDEIEELQQRLKLAHAMGGPEGIRKQHDNGKLTVRERIKDLSDDGSFREISALSGSGRYVDNDLVSFTPYTRVIGTA